jgi:hypothetical protein
MAAVADPKENLACLAFAYFLKNPDYKTNSEQHKEEWINIFKDFKITQLSQEYKSHLEPNFNFSVLKSKYSFEKGKGDVHLEAIYNQMVSLFNSSFLKAGKDYRIYGQDSVFVDTIKNKCLTRLSKVFADALSAGASVTNLTPADFYIVNHSKVNEIKKDFNDTIIKPKKDETILLNYFKFKDKTYAGLIKKYLKTGDLIPISHKMPKGRDSTTSVKLAGDISKIGKVPKGNLDPYSQLVIVLGGKSPIEVEKIIEDVIDIKYDKWDVRDAGSASTWKLFFDFNYKKIDPEFDNTIFGLEPLPAMGSGSFNGKFYIDASKSASTPWVAGMAPKSLEPFLRKYSGYNQIMRLLSIKLLRVFDDIILSELNRTNRTTARNNFTEIKKLSSHKKCSQLLSSRGFHTFKELEKVMKPFFEEMQYASGFELYQKNVIRMIKNEGGFRTNVDAIPNNRVYEHYTSLLLSYFFFVGGRTFRTFLKKAIFFTIFGAITKRGFVKVGGSGTSNLLSKKVSFGKMYEDVEVSLTAAPHLIML